MIRQAFVSAFGLVALLLAGGRSRAETAGEATNSAMAGAAPHAVASARTTALSACTVFVDSASVAGGNGTAQKPHATIANAIDSSGPGAVICVAEGTYAEQLKPGEKYFTLAGGFAHGKDFKVRDSAIYISKALGHGGSFIRLEDPAPKGDQLIAIDGFEITGYAQAIVRDYYESQRFDITNNFIHDNICTDQSLAGGGFALNNVSGSIKGNVFKGNSCGRGGAGFLNDSTNSNTVVLESNLVENNAGTEPDSAHGGAFYLFGNKLEILGNAFIGNSVTQWGGGLYVGAFTAGNQPTTAKLSWNIYRGNRAGNAGGGFFCDDGAACFSSHEIYDRNCGGNILVDGGPGGSGPTITRFDHITNTGALTSTCDAPGIGAFVDTYEAVAPDTHSFSNAIFWGNAEGSDLAVACGSGCGKLTVTVANSMVQTKYADGSVKIGFGPGIVSPADPLFISPSVGDFHLRAGSPVIGKAGDGSDLGAYAAGGDRVALKAPAAPASVVSASPAPVATIGGEPAPPPSAQEPAPPQPHANAKPGATTDTNEIPAKEAFEIAKSLGTIEAWNAYLASYPNGFLADIARAYVKKLSVGVQSPAIPLAPASGLTTVGKGTPIVGSGKSILPAVSRGSQYMGFPERFNRYYTDKAWQPDTTLYVSPNGGGDGASPDAPAAVKDAIAAAKPGTKIQFARGAYTGSFEVSKDNSGTYDNPILLYGERNTDGSIGVSITCGGGRQSCFNLEAASYIAIDGFELVGGKYGVRAVGAGFAASQHSRGIAVLNSTGHDQDKDPFFSGQSDWTVWEGLVASGAGKGDGHGIYISNGGDWNIVRYSETFSNTSSDFQINADPASTCAEPGIPFTDPRCDAYAGEGEGGQGASDYFLVDGNYFHHGLGPGANFTSLRRSVIRNNVFGLQATKHNVSFWQETDNPKLGSSDNKILHNLFISTGRHGVQFTNQSTRNEFANNVILGVQLGGAAATANPSALLMEVDGTVGENVYRANFYSSGVVEGRKPVHGETVSGDFSPTWFKNFPNSINHDANDFTPSAAAPFLALGALLPGAPVDRNETIRPGSADLGPIEVP